MEAAGIKVRLGVLRSVQGRHAEAETLLKELVEFTSKGASPFYHANALSALGAAQLAYAKPHEAFDALNQAEAMQEKLESSMSPDRADLLVNLAQAHIALGRPNEAVAAAGRAAAFWQEFDPKNRSAGVALLWHARALASVGDTQKRPPSSMKLQ